MSLYDILIKEPYNEEESFTAQTPELLGETLTKLEYTECDDTYTYLYNEKFNNYAIELTISPKSSPRLRREACCACGATSLRELHEQYEIMMQLIEELINKYKINILGTVELYKDNKNLHCHCIMNNQSQNKLYNIKKYVKNYYQLNNNNIINISPVNNRELFKKYLIKQPYGEYFYYHENKEKTIVQIEKEVIKIKTENNKKCKCKITECNYCKSIASAV